MQAAGRRDVANVVDATVAEHRLDALWHRDPAQLSGGQQQRVAVAAIEACDVDVLVFDEPTAMLDAPARRACFELLRTRAGGRAVAWITQVPDEVAACDRVVVLDAGVVAWSGSVREFVGDRAIAATWDLELPVAARVAHELAARGAWPSGAPIPVELDDLRRTLAVAGGAGG